jgi:hypothetical protein
MPWSNWFTKRPAHRPATPGARRRRTRLGFETLEERTTPAVSTTLVSAALPTTAGAALSITSASAGASFAADENLLVFSSDASNLVPGDTNNSTDVFLADVAAGTLTRLSVAADGTQADGPSFFPSISADGRYVAFQSYATNLVGADINGTADVFVKDLQTGAVALVSTNAAGAIADNFSSLPAISANGQYVVFSSFASNLTPDDTDSFVDIFRKNWQSGQIDLVSETAANVKADADSINAAISADGRYIAFATFATNLLPAGGDDNDKGDIYRKDMNDGTLELVSADAAGTLGDDESTSPLISADGNIVVFASAATNLLASDNNDAIDVFTKNMTSQAVTRVSVATDGTELGAPSGSPSINGDATKISFVTADPNVVSGDANQVNDVFLRDTVAGMTTRLCTRGDGSEAARGGDGGRLSPSAAKVAFFSTTDDFDASDTNGLNDVYVKTLAGGAVTLISHGSPVSIGGNDNSFVNFDVPQLAADGRSVVFVSSATNLVAGTDSNGAFRDVYLRDVVQGTTTRISADANGVQGNGDSTSIAVNPTGATSLIVFSSTSDNLAPGDSLTFEQVYLKNPVSGAIVPVSVTAGGEYGDGDSYSPVISGNGQFVAFITFASNLFDDDTFFEADVAVKNLATGAFTLVSADAAGAQVGGNISGVSISDDGRYVAFASDADGLVTGDANGKLDVFVKDLLTGTLTLVSKDALGAVGNGNSTDPVLSGDGQFLAFVSDSTNLVTGDTNGVADVFRADLSGGLVRVNTLPDGTQAAGLSGTVSISQGGRYVAFASEASNLVAGDANTSADVFVKDVQTGAIYLVSQSSTGALGNSHSLAPSLSRDGRTVAYASVATNLAVNDVNAFQDVFLTTLNQAPAIVLTGTLAIDEGQPLSLDASGTTDADGDTLGFSWDLNGDGVFGDATGSSFTLTAAQLDALGMADGPNVFNAQLVVTDAFGPVVRDFDVTVANVAPTATITPGTVDLLEGGGASFTGSAADPSNADVAAGIALSWVVTRNGASYRTGTGAALSFNLVDDGDYVVTLTATDQDNGQGTATYSFHVANQAPVVAPLNAPAAGAEGTPISFAVSASDAGPADQAAGLTISWTVSKNGAAYTSGSGATVAFTPNDNGSYEIHVTASDKDLAASATQSATIAVANVAPDLHIAPTASVNEGATYSLGLMATDPGADTVSSWLITWGDGTTPESFPGTATSASHVYADGLAARTLEVVATDEDGQYTASQSVTVADVAPTVALTGAANVAVDVPYQLHLGPLVDPGADPETAVVIHWGDSTSDTVPLNGFDQTYQHTYTAPANVTISVSVTNGDGTFEAGSKSLQVGASNTPPTIAISGPGSTTEGATYALSLGPIDNPSGQPITGYRIAWGDGESITETGLPPANVTHVYADGAAARTITVSLLNGAAAYDNPATLSVAVANVAPTAALSAPASTPEGSSITLTLGPIVDPGTDTIASYIVQWGDGNIDSDLGPPPSTFTHTYTDGDGDRTITLLLTDEDGTHTAGSTAIHVVNVAPTVALSAPASTPEGSSITLTLGPIVDPGTDTIASYIIQWGDGNIDSDLGPPPSTLTHTYTDGDGDRTITLLLSDEDGTYTAGSTAIHVANVAPAFEAGADESLTQGGTLTRSGSFTDPGADDWTATVDYGDGQGTQPLALSGMGYTLSHVYPEDGTFTVTVTIADGDGGSHSDSFIVTVASPNTAPSFDAGADAALNEGGTLTRSGSFTDPDDDTWTATVNYGDGFGTQPLALVGKTYVLDHAFTQNGSFTVTVSISDGTATVSDSFVVDVANVAPEFDAGGNASLNEGDTFTRSGSFTDPGSDTWVATVNWGDSTGSEPLVLVGKTYTLNHVFAQEGSFTVQIEIVDGTSTTTRTFVANVANVLPTVSAGNDVTLPAATFTGSGSFTDPGADTWTATVNYGDNTGTQTLTLTGKTFALNHTYSQKGVFTVTVTVNDGTGSSTDTLLVTNTTGNNAPVITLPGTASINEGSNYTASGSFTDPDADTWTATVDYGLGGGPQTLVLTNKTFSLNNAYPNNGPFTVTVKVSDGVATTTATATVTVANVAPVITAGGNTTITVGSTFTRSGSFTDPGADTWTGTVNYGDGSGPSALTLAANKTFALSHAYTQLGTFPVTITIFDGVDTSTATFNVQVTEPDPGDDFVGRDAITGELYVARSTGSRFITTNYQGIFNPTKTWVDVIAADFDGDGRDDVMARDQASAEWWLARNAGTTFVLNKWETWNNRASFVDVRFFDLNNDGKFDILAREPSAGDWWASFSQGTTGRAELVGNWDPAKSWVDVQFGDLNKDGRTDLIGRLAGTGQLFASLNQPNATILGNAKLINQNGPWTTLSDGNAPGKTTWTDVQLADVNGDGRLDYIGRAVRTGHWYVNLGSAGKPSGSQFWTAWNPAAAWAATSMGDVNGDGKADLIGHTLDGGEWWVGLSPATAGGPVNNEKWSAAGFFYTDVFVGDFNNDGKTDVAGLRAGTGEWSVGLATGDDFSFSVWDTWPTNPARLAVRRGRFAS